MKLGFSPDFPLLSADLEFTVDVEVEWDGGADLSYAKATLTFAEAKLAALVAA